MRNVRIDKAEYARRPAPDAPVRLLVCNRFSAPAQLGAQTRRRIAELAPERVKEVSAA